MKQAEIYVNDVLCGILTEDEEGFHFSYEEAYLVRQGAVPVSPTMPLTYGGNIFSNHKVPNFLIFQNWKTSL